MPREDQEEKTIAGEPGKGLSDTNSDEESSGVSISEEEISLTDDITLTENQLVNHARLTPKEGGTYGFLGGIGGCVGGVYALMSTDSPHFIEITALDVAFCTFFFVLAAGCQKNIRECDVTDLLIWASVATVIITASTGVMCAGAALTVAANVTELAPIAGITMGASGVNVLTTTAVGLLAGYSIFKGTECLSARNVQNDRAIGTLMVST